MRQTVYIHQTPRSQRENFFELSRVVPGVNQKRSAFWEYRWLEAWGFWRIGLSPILQKKNSLSAASLPAGRQVRLERALNFSVRVGGEKNLVFLLFALGS